MIFKETWQQVLNGTKTQTRRPVKPNESGVLFPGTIQAVFTMTDWQEETLDGLACRTRDRKRVKWQLDHTYTVQPGRGKPVIWLPPEGAPIDDPLAEYIRKTESVRATWGPKVKAWLRAKGYQEARIRITKIRRERLQEISDDDCLAEGIKYRFNRLENAFRAYNIIDPAPYHIAYHAFRALWGHIYRKPYRWEDDIEVWVLEFEKVKE